MAWEALNNIAHTTRKFIGILNDNEWSIAKNVGAIAKHLGNLTTSPRYNKFAKDFATWLKKLPKGELVAMLGHKAEEALKGMASSVVLEQAQPGPGSDGRAGQYSLLSGRCWSPGTRARQEQSCRQNNNCPASHLHLSSKDLSARAVVFPVFATSLSGFSSFVIFRQQVC